nr:hypothetical protein [Nitrospirota bacterium]
MNARYSRHHSGRLFVLISAALWLAALSTGLAQERTTPQTADRQAQRLLVERCTICHSIDLIQQQRLPRDRWDTTVKKMVHWGAQLDEAERAMLVNYLARSFHPESGPVAN